MKILFLITIYHVLTLQLVRAETLRRRTTIRSDPSTLVATNTLRRFASAGSSDASQRECQLMRTQDECNLIDHCGWIDSRCTLKVSESCGFMAEKSVCEASMNCVWMFDDDRDTRQGTSGRCTENEDTGDTGEQLNCTTPESKSACNSAKGCSWVEDGNSKYCSVAPTQLVCNDFRGRKTCEDAGCLFKKKQTTKRKTKKKTKKKKKKKKEKECVGRWEYEFLSTMKGTIGNEAEQAIKNEFGDATYEVVLVHPDDKKRYRRRNRTRIKLFLDDEGRVKKTPRFG